MVIGNINESDAKLAESERVIGKLYDENAFLKSFDKFRDQIAGASKSDRRELIYMTIQNMCAKTDQISINKGCSAL